MSLLVPCLFICSENGERANERGREREDYTCVRMWPDACLLLLYTFSCIGSSRRCSISSDACNLNAPLSYWSISGPTMSFVSRAVYRSRSLMNQSNETPFRVFTPSDSMARVIDDVFITTPPWKLLVQTTIFLHSSPCTWPLKGELARRWSRYFLFVLPSESFFY